MVNGWEREEVNKNIWSIYIQTFISKYARNITITVLIYVTGRLVIACIYNHILSPLVSYSLCPQQKANTQHSSLSDGWGEANFYS